MNVFPEISFESAEALARASKDVIVFEPASGMSWAFNEEDWYYHANKYNYKVLRQMQQVDMEQEYIFILIEL